MNVLTVIQTNERGVCTAAVPQHEREREREGGRETDRQTDRQTDRESQQDCSGDVHLTELGLSLIHI